MNNPHEITFDYELPRRLIAQEPLANRADARLMVVDRPTRTIEHHHVRDLPQLLKSGDRLVLNDTRVIPAQLQGVRTPTGGKWQGLYLESPSEGLWKIVCKTRGRLQPGESITILDRDLRPQFPLLLVEQLAGGEWLAQPVSPRPAAQLLEQVGRVPLPHYIRGGRMVDSDVVNYQTVYARRPGAVAAPTAGLHLTESLLRAVKQAGIDLTSVTLHVGLGTFRPIQAERLDDHTMHEEWCEVTPQAVADLLETRERGGRNIAVGTTVVRTLEAAAAAAQSSGEATLTTWQGKTELFIRPPYEFRMVDALLTNFHFPRTTLLVLVQTFGGGELIRQAYELAIQEEYRFFSYGDAMLIT